MKQFNTRQRFSELKTINELPSPSGVALKIVKLAQKEYVTTTEIANLVRTDPALAGRLLKFANSAAIGFSRSIASLHDAVVVLGVKVVQQLALGLSVLSNSLSGPCRQFDYPKFWSTSLARAFAAQIICSRNKYFNPDEAFTYALLCEVGKLALASMFPDSYAEVLEKEPDNLGSNLIRAERDKFFTDHVELTVTLMEEWGLPEISVNAVSLLGICDDLSKVQQTRIRNLAFVLQGAAQIAKLCDVSVSEQTDFSEELLICFEQLGIEKSAVNKIIDEVTKLGREWGKMLELPTPKVPSFNKYTPIRNDVEPKDQNTQNKNNGLRILLINDDKSETLLLKKMLENAGHQVITASNCDRGLEITLNSIPEIVIASCTIANTQGVEFCKILRETKTFQFLYVILLVSGSEEGYINQAYEAGADDCIVKPYNPGSLVARILAAERLVGLHNKMLNENIGARRDLVDIALMNRKVQAERDKAQLYLDTADVMLIALDCSGAIELINRKGCQILGYQEQQLLHHNWFNRCLPDDIRENQRKQFHEMMSGCTQLVPYCESVVTTCEGDRRVIAWHNNLIRNETNEIKGLLSSGHDITRQIQEQLERERLQRQLMDAKKMESIGHLTGGIAHDFNNILTSILGYCSLAKDQNRILENSKLKRYLNEIHIGGNRAKDLVAKMLAYSHGAGGVSEFIDMRKAVNDILNILREQISKDVRMDVLLEKQLPLIKFNLNNLKQVITNLILNACEAIQNKGPVKVRLNSSRIVKKECASCHKLVDGNYMELSIGDGGPGIPEKLISTIFEPFFTTKKVRKGTGLGLSVVHGIVHSERGHIFIDTQAGRGTRVTIVIPLT